MDKNLGVTYERLKNFYKYESAVLRQNGKVGLKYTCLNCHPVQTEPLICPVNPVKALGNHIRYEHPQLLAKYYEATAECPTWKFISEPNLFYLVVKSELFLLSQSE